MVPKFPCFSEYSSRLTVCNVSKHNLANFKSIQRMVFIFAIHTLQYHACVRRDYTRRNAIQRLAVKSAISDARYLYARNAVSLETKQLRSSPECSQWSNTVRLSKNAMPGGCSADRSVRSLCTIPTTSIVV